VLIFPSGAFQPAGGYVTKSATPDLRLPSQFRSITAPPLVTNHTGSATRLKEHELLDPTAQWVRVELSISPITRSTLYRSAIQPHA